MHGKTSTVVHDGKGVFAGITAPFQAGRYHSLVIAGDRVPQELEVAARTKEDDTIMAGPPPHAPGARRAVSSRVGADRRRAAPPSEFPRAVMLTELLEKVVRHEDLTAEEAAGAMREVMEGRAAPASLAALSARS